MLGILSIPRGNAECERQFSVVRKTRMQFRCSVCDKTLGNVLTTKCQKNGPFCSQTYSEEFLKAKSAAPKCLQKCLLDSGAVVCKCGNKNANNLSACEFSVVACLAFGDAKAYGLTPTILGQEGMDNRGSHFVDASKGNRQGSDWCGAKKAGNGRQKLMVGHAGLAELLSRADHPAE